MHWEIIVKPGVRKDWLQVNLGCLSNQIYKFEILYYPITANAEGISEVQEKVQRTILL